MRARTAQAQKWYCAPPRLSNATRLTCDCEGRVSAVLDAVLALPHLNNVAVRIADIAARFAILHDRLCDELRASALPFLVASLDVRHAEIHEAIDVIRIGRAKHHRRLVGRGPSPDVDDHPYIREPQIPRRTLAVGPGQNGRAEYLFVVPERPLDIRNGDEVRDADPFLRRHLIAFLFDSYAAGAHLTPPSRDLAAIFSHGPSGIHRVRCTSDRLYAVFLRRRKNLPQLPRFNPARPRRIEQLIHRTLQ